MISQARAYFDRFSLFNEHRCGNIWAIILDIQAKTLSANKDKSKFSLNQSKLNDRFTSDRIQIVNMDGGGLQQSKIQAKKCIRNGIKVGLICHGYVPYNVCFIDLNKILLEVHKYGFSAHDWWFDCEYYTIYRWLSFAVDYPIYWCVKLELLWCLDTRTQTTNPSIHQCLTGICFAKSEMKIYFWWTWIVGSFVEFARESMTLYSRREPNWKIIHLISLLLQLLHQRSS